MVKKGKKYRSRSAIKGKRSPKALMDNMVKLVQQAIEAKASLKTDKPPTFPTPTHPDFEPPRESPKQKTKASASGSGFIKGQTLKPINEKYVIGSAAPLPYNDLSNDSFLIKPRTYEPVV
jgi:hypothetical protein